MIVRDLVKRRPVTASKEATLSDLARLMKENEVGSVVIVENDRPIGIVTERDLVIAIADGVDPQTKAKDFMSYDPVKVKYDTDVTAALSIMISRNIRHLVVVDESQRLIGVVSSRDLLKAVGSIALDLAIW